ncbi:MAG: putative DNA binding domain-containing protein [Candidatus Brockarchaeota archaeon]|nr:putative DNA binding domain-containing protein [Candidatus Brockarchaeota archaeon]
MTDLQELISRARFIFSGAPERLEVFKLIDGKRSTKDIARKMGRSLSSVLHDVKTLKDMELIEEKKDLNGNIIRKERAVVYEKAKLIKHVPLSYFQEVAETGKLVKKIPTQKAKGRRPTVIHVPSEREILDICKQGEDQIYEFKAPGTEMAKITKECAAFLHTKNGGIIFYGVQDDGSILGSDLTRQEFDQRIQNSARNTISPPPNIEVKERNVMGSKIILIIIPPWDRKTIYQYTLDNRYYIRKGTNVFALKPEEIKKLSKGEVIV